MLPFTALVLSIISWPVSAGIDKSKFRIKVRILTAKQNTFVYGKGFIFSPCPSLITLQAQNRPAIFERNY